jgi:hypothetical protein
LGERRNLEHNIFFLVTEYKLCFWKGRCVQQTLPKNPSQRPPPLNNHQPQNQQIFSPNFQVLCKNIAKRKVTIFFQNFQKKYKPLGKYVTKMTTKSCFVLIFQNFQMHRENEKFDKN